MAGVHELTNQSWATEEACQLTVVFNEASITMDMSCEGVRDTLSGIEPSIEIEAPWGGRAAAQCSCITRLGAIYSRGSREGSHNLNTSAVAQSRL